MSDNKFGFTGQFPEGKLNDHDLGEIRFGVAADVENGLVLIEFGTPVKALAMRAESVMRLVRSLVDKASDVQGVEDGSARGKVGEGGLCYHSIVSHRTQEGFVQLSWGAEGGQLSIEETRGLAIALLDAASAAENDALLVKFFLGVVKMPAEDAAKVLDGLRRLRTEKQAKEG